MIKFVRVVAGLPVLAAAFFLADFGAHELAYKAREAARWIAGIDAPRKDAN